MRILLPVLLITLFSNMAWSDAYPTLTVKLGDKIIAQTSEFIKPEYCGYFADRINRHDPIINKDGKLEKMHAYCSYNNSPIPLPVFKPTLEKVSGLKNGEDTAVDNGKNILEKSEYYVHLASYKNGGKARMAVDIFNEELAVPLYGHSLQVVSEDLGSGKGVWWRVITEFFEKREKAEFICALIMARGGSCIVRSRVIQYF